MIVVLFTTAIWIEYSEYLTGFTILYRQILIKSDITSKVDFCNTAVYCIRIIRLHENLEYEVCLSLTWTNYVLVSKLYFLYLNLLGRVDHRTAWWYLPKLWLSFTRGMGRIFCACRPIFSQTITASRQLVFVNMSIEDVKLELLSHFFNISEFVYATLDRPF